MNFYYNGFSKDNFTKGQLITVEFKNGAKRSGIITSVFDNGIDYSYVDSVSGTLEDQKLTKEYIESNELRLIVSEHLKENKKNDEKIGFTNNTQKQKTFFDMLKTIKNVEPLIRAFKNEDAQTLALIASFLGDKPRTEFLYKLPDALFSSVNNALKNVKDVNEDILDKIEAKLSEKFNEYKRKNNFNEQESNRSNKQERKQQPFQDFGADIPFGDIFGGLFGGSNNSAPNQNQLKEMIEEAVENMPKMLNEMFENFNPKNDDDDDDDDYPRRKF